MRVTMRTSFSGYRNGEPWPPVGGSIDLPDTEAADLIANGYAKEATNEGPAEHDDAPPDADGDDEAAADDGSEADAGPPEAGPADAAASVKPKRTRARKS